MSLAASKFDEAPRDQFGGVAVKKVARDEFGGVAVEEAPPLTKVPVPLSLTRGPSTTAGRAPLTLPDRPMLSQIGGDLADLAEGLHAGAPESGKALAKVAGEAGRGLKDIAAAYAFEAARDPVSQAQQLGIPPEAIEQRMGFPVERMPPGQTPFERGMEESSPAVRVLGNISKGTIESLPKMAAVSAAQAAGVPLPVAAGLIFGQTEEGFDVKQAAIGAALPFIGKYGGELTGLVGEKLGAQSTDVINAIKAMGGMTAVAGAIGAADLNEIMKLPPEKRMEAMAEAIGGQILLGPMGVKFKETTPAELTGKYLLKQIRKSQLAGGEEVSPLVREINRLEERPLRKVEDYTGEPEPTETAVKAGEFPVEPKLPPKQKIPGTPPEVPATPPEPEKVNYDSAVSEIRAKGARTIRQIQDIFPKAELSREQARVLRNLAFPDTAAKPPEAPTPAAPAAKPIREVRKKVDYGKREVVKREGDLFDFDNDDDLAFELIPALGTMTVSKAKAKFGKNFKPGQRIVAEIVGKEGKKQALVIDEIVEDKPTAPEKPKLQLTPVLVVGKRLFKGADHETARGAAAKGATPDQQADALIAFGDDSQHMFRDESTGQLLTRQQAAKLFNEATGQKIEALQSSDLQKAGMLEHVGEAGELALKPLPDNTKITVSHTEYGGEKTSYFQADVPDAKAPGGSHSFGPDRAHHFGFKLDEDFTKLPAGTYTLAEARAKMAEAGKPPKPVPPPGATKEAVDLANQHDPQNMGALLGAYQHAHKAGYRGEEAQRAAWGLYAAKADKPTIANVGEWMEKTKRIEELMRPAQAAPPRKGGKRVIYIHPRDDGVRDILEAIQEFGGIRLPKEGSKGEYDGWEEARIGVARLLFGHNKTHTPDTLLEKLHGNGEFKNVQTPSDLWQAIKNAVKQRDELKATGGGASAQTDRFWTAVYDPENKKGLEQINMQSLNVGDRFSIRGEGIGDGELEVINIDPDSMDIQVRGDSKLGIQDIPDGADLWIKKGSIKRASEKGEEPVEPPQPPAAPPAAPPEAPPEPPKPPEPPPGTPKPPLFDPKEQARVDELLKRLKDKLGRFTEGGAFHVVPPEKGRLDPEFFQLGGELAYHYLKAGVRKFGEFAEHMIRDLGDKAKGYLLSWYSNARNQLKDIAHELDDEATAQKEYDKRFGAPAAPAAAGGRPGVRVARSELIPTPKEWIKPDRYAAKSGFTLDSEQTKGVNLILDWFSKNREKGSFLLADGPGFGKTAQCLAVADQYVKNGFGHKVLIVTQNKQIAEGRFKADAHRMGIDPSGFEITTYTSLNKLMKHDWDLVIWDESHNLKNADAQKSIAAARLNAKHELFATATPMDRPSGAAYFLSKITGEDYLTVANKLGYTFQSRQDPLTQKIIEVAVPLPGMNWPKIWDNIIAYRDAAVSAGAMIRREYPFYGSVNSVNLSMGLEEKMEHERIAAHYDRLIERSRNPTAKRNYAGQKTLTLSRWSEQHRLEHAVNAALEHLKKGGQVVIVAETDKEQSFPQPIRDGRHTTKPDKYGNMRDVWVVDGAITRLKQMLAAKGITDVADIHDPSKHDIRGEVDKFQSGKAKVALATPQSGGTGIDLDDVKGSAPRLMLALSKNFAGDAFEQLVGRISRKNTKSESVVNFLNLLESHGDERRNDVLANKIKTLKAIQGGEELDRAGGLVTPAAPQGGRELGFGGSEKFTDIPDDEGDIEERIYGYGGSTAVMPPPPGPAPSAAPIPSTPTTPTGLARLTNLRLPGLNGPRSLLMPSGMSPEHLQAAETLGAHLGMMHRRDEAVGENLRKAGRYFDRLGVNRDDLAPGSNPGLKFASDVSQGRPLTGPMKAIADQVDALFTKYLALLEETGAGLETIRKNYFPGMWTKESRLAFNAAMETAIRRGIIPKDFDVNTSTAAERAAVKGIVDQYLKDGTASEKDALAYLTRRPLAGKESFRKQKVFDDIMNAAEMGLRPISNNPIDLVKLKLAEMSRSIMMHGYMQHLNSKGELAVVNPYHEIPEGWEKLNDKYGTIYGPPTVKLKEYVDFNLWHGLSDIIQKLGIRHSRVMSSGRGALGLASTAGWMKTNFATELSVMAHELGHHLDFKYQPVEPHRQAGDWPWSQRNAHGDRLAKAARPHYEATARPGRLELRGIPGRFAGLPKQGARPARANGAYARGVYSRQGQVSGRGPRRLQGV